MPLQRRVIADRVRRVAVRHLPHQLAVVEIDRGEHAVRRLDERQTLHGQAAAAAACRRRRRRRRRAAPRRGAAAAARRRVRRGRAAAAALRRVGRAAEARAFALDERLPRGARDVADVGEPGRRLDQADRRDRVIARLRVDDVRFRIVRRRPASWCRPSVVPIVSAASGPSTLLTTAGRNIGPSL